MLNLSVNINDCSSTCTIRSFKCETLTELMMKLSLGLIIFVYYSTTKRFGVRAIFTVFQLRFIIIKKLINSPPKKHRSGNQLSSQFI